jgi:hypothetical protein
MRSGFILGLIGWVKNLILGGDCGAAQQGFSAIHRKKNAYANERQGWALKSA